MIYCSNCGCPNPDEAKFCQGCGASLFQNQGTSKPSQNSHETKKKKDSSSWVDSLNDYVGNDKPADLNWRMLFTDVFKSHTTEEAEEIFICGTRSTTPPPALVSKEWPHPWLWSRVLIILLAATFLLWVCVSTFNNTNALPGMIVMGSFAVPIATMILFMEVNAWKNVSVYYVLMTFLVGGCASLVATLFLYSIYTSDEMDYFGAFMTGLFEEIGKAVIVYIFLRHLGKLNILSGMLIGACVGAGFAAFESAGYAMKPILEILPTAGVANAIGNQEAFSSMITAMYENINTSIIMRGLLAPGGHVAWAAISGAALVIAAKAKGKIDTSLFFDGKFLKLFIIPVVLHTLWDCPLMSVFYEIMPFSGHIALIMLVWIVVLIFVNMGLAEVSRSK